MLMRTKKTGTITENEVELALRKSGASVSLPRGDDDAYDLIADIDGKLIRIQVKTARSRTHGAAFSFCCTRNKYFKNGIWLHQKYEEGEMDYFATVWNGQTYLVPAEECGQEKQLRISPTKNGIKSTVNWAKDYELEKVVDRLKTTE